VKDQNGDLLANTHNILNRRKNYFSQLLNVHNISDVRQIEVHTAEPLVPGPSCLEAEIATAKMRKYKSPSSDEIPVELIQAQGELLQACSALILPYMSWVRLASKMPRNLGCIFYVSTFSPEKIKGNVFKEPMTT
jgi:hypothetical protein